LTDVERARAVSVALELGNDLNAVDKNGETAMHGAAYKHVPTVESAEQKGLDAAQDRRRCPAGDEHRQFPPDGGGNS
jgi:hypothetical protein